MVLIGRGGPHLAKGIFVMKKSLEALNLPHVIFGPDTPVSLVAEYAAKLTHPLAPSLDREGGNG